MNRNLLTLSKATYKGRHHEWTLLVHSKNTDLQHVREH